MDLPNGVTYYGCLFGKGDRTSYSGVAVRQATQPQSKPPHVTPHHVPTSYTSHNSHSATA